ncbi:hypothetical protein [Flagellimonas baculiformis]|uniref:hypothetical protein n=1 Tax=Flagellimonas baculiformis TaxID=3067310 RepID=UPI00296ECCD7|nr:hypothetical protein [Muricauda sp. D6]
MSLKHKITNNYRWIILPIFGMIIVASCTPEGSFGNNGLSDTNVDASFTITPVEGQANRYVLEANTTNVIASKWNIGEGIYQGKSTEEIFLPDAGSYTITHIAIGRGGTTISSSQELVVEESDPNAGNLVVGGKFETEEDIAQWTILNISASGANWTFGSGTATITASDWNQQGIFQAIEVQGGKNYAVDMTVQGEGSVDTWFEVYVSTTGPVQGSDYSADGTKIGLNTWNGCGNAPFSGKLSQLSCAGEGNIVSFDTDTTVYLVVKCGGGNVGAITIDNVELRGTN